MLSEWHRLERVIRWTGFSVNAFGLNIGLKRSENLYQIKRGNNGISKDLVDMIATKYPTISKGWLMTGEGTMFIDPPQQDKPPVGIPYYGMDAAVVAEANPKPEPQSRLVLPMFKDCDLAAINIGTAMTPEIPAGGIVLLRKWDKEKVVPGGTYLILSTYFEGIRTVRSSAT